MRQNLVAILTYSDWRGKPAMDARGSIPRTAQKLNNMAQENFTTIIFQYMRTIDKKIVWLQRRMHFSDIKRWHCKDENECGFDKAINFIKNNYYRAKIVDIIKN